MIDSEVVVISSTLLKERIFPKKIFTRVFPSEMIEKDGKNYLIGSYNQVIVYL